MTNKELIKLESALVNRVMDDPATRDSILPILKPDYLFERDHQAIMRAVVSLSDNDLPIDIITVKNWLNKNEPQDNWASIVGTLEVANFSEKPIHHARIIQEQYLRRRVQNELTAVIKNSQNESSDIFQSLNSLSEFIDNSLADTQADSFRSFAEIKEQTKQEIITGDISGVLPSGLAKFDEKLMMRSGNLVVVAARPAMGKSAFMSTIAKNIASNGVPVYVFSLEMEDTEIVDRMVSGDVKIANGKIINRQLDEYEERMFLDAVDEVQDIPLYVYDKGGLNMRILKSELRKASKTTGVGAVFLDYIQLMNSVSSNSNREQEVSKISRELKALSKELKVPIIALSQLSRQCENREFKLPQLSDLRESGAIEQDADAVVLLWRPSYYGYKAIPFDLVTREESDTVVEESDAYAIIAKNRKGDTGACLLNFQGMYARFTD